MPEKGANGLTDENAHVNKRWNLSRPINRKTNAANIDNQPIIDMISGNFDPLAWITNNPPIAIGACCAQY
ncbi:MAG: hypothetical protein HRU25_16660 [Psychrobium sp.]|nr:hypothetical protein [Psychrobium sp.]